MTFREYSIAIQSANVMFCKIFVIYLLQGKLKIKFAFSKTAGLAHTNLLKINATTRVALEIF